MSFPEGPLVIEPLKVPEGVEPFVDEELERPVEALGLHQFGLRRVPGYAIQNQ